MRVRAFCVYRFRDEALSNALFFFVPGAPVTGNRRLVLSRGRRVNSREYAAYKARVTTLAKAAMLQYKFSTVGKADLSLVLHKSRLDIDNCAKAILDGLEGARLFENDRDVWRLTIERGVGPRQGVAIRCKEYVEEVDR